MTFTLITDNVSWYRESVYKQVLSICNGDFKHVFISFFILISLILPLSNTVEDENVEKGVKEDDIVFDGYTDEKYGHRRRGVSKV